MSFGASRGCFLPILRYPFLEAEPLFLKLMTNFSLLNRPKDIANFDGVTRLHRKLDKTPCA
jgi:hypothetical protein